MVVAVAGKTVEIGSELFVSVDGQLFRRAKFPVGFAMKENVSQDVFRHFRGLAI